jgi:hypothetical protein
MGWSPDEPQAPLAAVLFASQVSEAGFFAPAPVPQAWQPGTRLELRGPLGKGFGLPPTTRRLALAALDDHAARLLPLLRQGLAQGAAIALFADCPLPDLPPAVELSPLSDLAGALTWADFLALDLSIAGQASLAGRLGLRKGERFQACPAQALLWTSMPCGGSGECGACAVITPRAWKRACSDGPVFDLNDLLV